MPAVRFLSLFHRRRQSSNPMPSHSNTFRLVYIFLMFAFFREALPAQEADSRRIDIVYTGNLNCVLDDCGCGGDTVGGLTRIKPLVDSLRRRLPQLILLDAGDFMSSYSLPEANSVMLLLMAALRYDALNLGDQEFVEKPAFWNSLDSQAKDALPMLAGNIDHDQLQKTMPAVRLQRALLSQGISVTGVVDIHSFEFIAAPPKGPAGTESFLASWVKEPALLRILLFHGSWERARALAARFPGIDLIILAHNQQRKFETGGGRALAESGADGQFVGHITARRVGETWRFSNEFIPVTRSLPVDPAARAMVDAYYGRIGAPADERSAEP